MPRTPPPEDRRGPSPTAFVALIALLCLPPPARAEDDAARALLEARARIAALEGERSLGDGKLAAFARDPRVAVRVAAVRALGRLQDPKAESTLVAALADAAPEVRREAAFALGQLPGAGVAALTARYEKETDPEVRRFIVEAVGRQGGDGAAPFLLARAAEGPGPERAAALNGLGLLAKRGDGEVSGLEAARLDAWLKDEDLAVRRGAAYALMRAKRLTDATTLGAARRCAGDADEEVRVRCVRALGRHAEAVDALVAALGDPSWRVRVAAVRGLGEQKAADALAKALQEMAPLIAAGKLDVEGPMLHPVVAALDAALDLPPSAALAAAARAVHQASTPEGTIAAPETGRRALGRSHVHCRAAALADRQRGAPRLVETCGAPDYPAALRRALQVRVVEGLPPARRVKALAAIYEKAGPPGRVAVLGVLRDLGGEAGARTLVLRALGEADPAVASEAAGAAAAMKLQAAVEPLINAYRRFMPAKEYEAVQSIFRALGDLEAKAASPILEEHAFHPIPAVRAAAIQAWKAIEGADARAPARMPLPAPATSGTVDLNLARPSPYRTATLRTTKGRVVIELFAEDAPRTVKNFVTLAQKDFYDGLTFHRVVPDFVVQGGDPRGDGWGGPGYTIPCEINPRRYERGTVGMALAGKDTGGSQFFITHGPQPHLDGGYTVFGRVREGMAIVDALTVGDRIVDVELSRGP